MQWKEQFINAWLNDTLQMTWPSRKLDLTAFTVLVSSFVKNEVETLSLDKSKMKNYRTSSNNATGATKQKCKTSSSPRRWICKILKSGDGNIQRYEDKSEGVQYHYVFGWVRNPPLWSPMLREKEHIPLKSPSILLFIAPNAQVELFRIRCQSSGNG